LNDFNIKVGDMVKLSLDYLDWHGHGGDENVRFSIESVKERVFVAKCIVQRNPGNSKFILGKTYVAAHNYFVPCSTKHKFKRRNSLV